MDQKERDTQRALGNLEEFQVTVTIPIKVKVRMTQRVMAVNEEDAIEKTKMIHDIIPEGELLRDAASKVQGFDARAQFDDDVARKFTARMVNGPKSMIDGATPPESCGTCDGGGTVMGHWGHNSYGSDTCHDILDKLDEDCKDNPSVEMLERLLTNCCCPRKVNTDYDEPRELYLGIVIRGLHHNVIVARKRLQHALRCARHLLNDDEYLKVWTKPKTRKRYIQSEITQIQKWLNLTPKEFKVQKALGSI